MPNTEQTQSFFSCIIHTDKGEFTLYLKDMIKLYFIEDVYSFSIVGRIQFIDSAGLLEFGPFTGNEYFTISWGVDGEVEKEVDLYIHKVNKIEKYAGVVGSQHSIIDLFLSDEYFKPLNTNPNHYSFNDLKISEIIKQISKLYLGINKFNIFEESKEKLDYFYTGLKTPAENIKWLLHRGSGMTSKVPGYLFYNSTEKTGWHLCTLEQLLSKQSCKLSEPKGFNHIYSFEDVSMYHINKILQYTNNKPDHSALKNLMGGVVKGFDSSRKKFLNMKLSYEDALNKFTILGKKTLFQKIYKIEENNYFNMLEGDADEDILENIWLDNWIKQYCLQQTFSFIVKGHAERSIGKQIEVEWPSTDNNETLNKQFLGRYLIKSITHQFSNYNNPFYVQKLVCIKNGYQDSDSNNLISSVKKNLG